MVIMGFLVLLTGVKKEYIRKRFIKGYQGIGDGE